MRYLKIIILLAGCTSNPNQEIATGPATGGTSPEDLPEISNTVDLSELEIENLLIIPPESTPGGLKFDDEKELAPTEQARKDAEATDKKILTTGVVGIAALLTAVGGVMGIRNIRYFDNVAAGGKTAGNLPSTPGGVAGSVDALPFKQLDDVNELTKLKEIVDNAKVTSPSKAFNDVSDALAAKKTPLEFGDNAYLVPEKDGGGGFFLVRKTGNVLDGPPMYVKIGDSSKIVDAASVVNAVDDLYTNRGLASNESVGILMAEKKIRDTQVLDNPKFLRQGADSEHETDLALLVYTKRPTPVGTASGGAAGAAGFIDPAVQRARGGANEAANSIKDEVDAAGDDPDALLNTGAATGQ